MGWEERRQGLVDQGMQRYGLNQFLAGGAYDPTNVLRMFQQAAGPLPQAQAPSVNRAMGYGQGAMDLAARAAAVQAGSAVQGLYDRQTNPAALMSVLGSVAQQAGANVGNAGLQGYGQGLDLLQRTDLANQAAALQGRSQLAGLFDSSMGRAFGASQFGASSYLDLIREYWNQRNQAQQQRAGMLGGSLGNLAGLGASYFMFHKPSQGEKQVAGYGTPMNWGQSNRPYDY